MMIFEFETTNDGEAFTHCLWNVYLESVVLYDHLGNTIEVWPSTGDENLWCGELAKWRYPRIIK